MSITIKGFQPQDFFDTYNLARGLSGEGNFLEAKKLIDIVIDFLMPELTTPMSFTFITNRDKASIFGFAGYIYGELGFEKQSLEYYRRYQYYNFQLKNDFNNEDNLRLFQFRACNEYNLTNLKNNQVSLVSPRKQNDIVDSPVFTWVDYVLGIKESKYKKHIPLLKQSFEDYKSTSFCKDTPEKKVVQNTLMWAHYANSHKGFCVEYSLDHSDFSRNDKRQLYTSRIFQIDYRSTNDLDIDLTDPNTILNSKQGFFTKSTDWSYENEVRLISYDPFSTEEYPSFVLGQKSKIVSIYFGVRCDDDKKGEIREALRDREVKYFQMRINPKNIFLLTFEEIKS